MIPQKKSNQMNSKGTKMISIHMKTENCKLCPYNFTKRPFCCYPKIFVICVYITGANAHIFLNTDIFLNCAAV